MRELKSISSLVDAFRRLPGVGLKSAERMAYQVLDMDKEKIQEFIHALSQVEDSISICPICGSYQENNQCPFCSTTKNSDTLIVVSYFKDALAFDKLNTYNGSFHILNGSLSPTKGVGIEDLNIKSLIKRIEEESFKEVILATNPTIDGETTALYISKLLEKFPVTVSRLASGLPMGGQVDYADELTLKKALEGRKTY